jgi:hypothetical protein
MSNVKLFKGWLTESAEAATPGPSISWASPVKATISKAADKGHNVIAVKSGDGRVFNYKIIGFALGKQYAINFNWLKKLSGGDMQIGRTVQGGVDPYTVEYDDLTKILPDLANGKSVDQTTLGTGVKFTKI